MRAWLLVVAACAACATAGERREAAAPRAGEGAAPAAGGAPGRAARLVAEGREALGEREWAEAAQAFEAAAALAPADPAPLAGLAEARQAQGRREEALAALGRALALREDAALLALRGRWLGQAGRLEAAAADLARATALDPGAGAAWATLAAVEVLRGDEAGRDRAFEGAVSALGRAAAVDRVWVQVRAMPPDPVQPQESLDRCTRGYAAMLDGQWADAQREQISALRYAPRYLWCIAGLAETAWRLGEPERAERILRRVIAEYPPAAEALRADAKGRLAALLLAQGREPAEAARLAREALAVRGERAALLERLALACRVAGDAACARDAAGRLLALPWRPPALERAARGWLADAP